MNLGTENEDCKLIFCIMRKNVFGRQFKRDTNERKALFKALMTSLVLKERIQTTEQKAKAIRGSVEKLVTKVKRRGDQALPYLLPYLHEDAVKKMMVDIAPRFTNRPGGYTRILRVGRRFNDDASLVLIEWVEKSTQVVVTKNKRQTKAAQTADMQASVETASPAKKEPKVKKSIQTKEKKVATEKMTTKAPKKAPKKATSQEKETKK